jgi:multicomponent Na+:H+ antiporter subunit G
VTLVLDVLGGVLLLVGSVFTIIGGVGLLRMPEFFTRLHAAGITDTLGAGAILLGLALQSNSVLVTVKLLIIFFFMLFTNPTASHALARAAVHAGLRTVPEPRAPRP